MKNKKLLVLLGLLTTGLLLLLSFAGKTSSKATLVTDVKGENLTSYVVSIDSVPTVGRGEGLVKEFDITPGKHDIIIEANGYSSYINEVDIRTGRNEIKTELIAFDGPEKALRQALGIEATSPSGSLGNGGETYTSTNGSFTIKNAAYFKNNTWLVARLVTNSQNSDGEVVVLQLVNGVWQVIASGTGISLGDLPPDAPQEIAIYVTSLNVSASNESNPTQTNTTNPSVAAKTQVNESSVRSSAARESCVTGTDQQLCESYLRSIGAYFVARSATTATRCGVGGGSFGGGYLTITFPNGVDETALAASIETYIRGRTPESPWLTIPNIGSRLVSEGKKYNVNPVLIVLLGVVESGLGTSSVARRQNNYFGQKASAGGYRTFASPEDSLFGPNIYRCM
jgi:flagellum-specific peptidoglycan hydrolase FlgJ